MTALQAPVIKLAGVRAHHMGHHSRGRWDERLYRSEGDALANHDVTIERTAEIHATDPRLVIFWPYDLVGVAAIDLAEVWGQVVKDKRSGALVFDETPTSSKDEMRLLTRLVVAREPGNPLLVTFEETGRRLDGLPLSGMFDGTIFNLTVIVHALFEDGQPLTNVPPAQLFKVRGIPIVQRADFDEGDHWELGARARFEPFTTKTASALEELADHDWDAMEDPPPEELTYTRLRRQEEVHFEQRKTWVNAASGAVEEKIEPIRDRFVLEVHAHHLLNKGKLEHEGRFDVGLQLQQKAGSSDATTRAYLVDPSSVVPIVAKKKQKGLAALGDLKTPESKKKKAKLKPIRGFEARLSDERFEITRQAPGRLVPEDSFYWLLPEDFVRSGLARITTAPMAIVKAGEDDGTGLRKVVLTVPRDWNRFVDDLIECVQHVQLSREWSREYGERYEKDKEELSCFSHVVEPILSALGRVRLMTEGATAGGKRATTLEKIHAAGPETGSLHMKLRALTEIAARAEYHAQAAVAVFMRQDFVTSLEGLKWVEDGKTFDVPSFSEAIEAAGERIKVSTKKAANVPYDDRFKLNLYSIAAGLLPVAGQGYVDGAGHARKDSDLRWRLETFQKTLLDPIAEVIRSELARSQGKADADRVVKFAATAFSQEEVWQSLGEGGGWAAMIYGREGDRSAIAHLVTGDKNATLGDLLDLKTPKEWDAVRQDYVRRHNLAHAGLEAFGMVFTGIKVYVQVRGLLAEGVDDIESFLDAADAVISATELILKSAQLIGGRAWFASTKVLSNSAKWVGRAAKFIDVAIELYVILEELWSALIKGKKLDTEKLVKATINLAVAVFAVAVPGVGTAVGFVWFSIQLVLDVVQGDPRTALPDWLCMTPWGEAPHFDPPEVIPHDQAPAMFAAACHALNVLFEAVYEDAGDARKPLKDFFEGYVAANKHVYEIADADLRFDDSGDVPRVWFGTTMLDMLTPLTLKFWRKKETEEPAPPT